MSSKKKLRAARKENFALRQKLFDSGYEAMAQWQAKERLGDELRTIEESLKRIREEFADEF